MLTHTLNVWSAAIFVEFIFFSKLKHDHIFCWSDVLSFCSIITTTWASPMIRADSMTNNQLRKHTTSNRRIFACYWLDGLLNMQNILLLLQFITWSRKKVYHSPWINDTLETSFSTSIYTLEYNITNVQSLKHTIAIRFNLLITNDGSSFNPFTFIYISSFFLFQQRILVFASLNIPVGQLFNIILWEYLDQKYFCKHLLYLHNLQK